MGVRFSAPIQTGPGAHPASYTMGTRSFLGVKWPGRGVDHPPPSSALVAFYRLTFTITFINFHLVATLIIHWSGMF